jgi:hypothetical protein
MAYLTASCIHQIFSLGSGDRQLYHLADRSRGILFSGLRSLKLLSRPKQRGKNEIWSAVTTPSGSTSLQSQWESWVEQERLKRLAWSAFEYDCSLCILTNRRAAVDLSELPETFPCAEALWQARTPVAWKALMSHMSENASHALPQVIIRGLLAGHAPPSDLPFWARRLSAQLVSRQLWDSKQAETAYISECFALPSAREIQIETKARLLGGLQILADSVAGPRDITELISGNIITLILHYSHLHAYGDLLDLLIYVVRSSVQSPPTDPVSIGSATQKLVAGLGNNPQGSRRLAWHAAQIVATALKFLVPAPCEILRVFMGYTFLMAFAKHGPHGGCFPCQGTADKLDGVSLDVTQATVKHKEAVERWIEHGGPAVVDPIGDICDIGAFSKIRQQALQTMGSLRHWGLAEKFTKILAVLEIDHAQPLRLD